MDGDEGATNGAPGPSILHVPDTDYTLKVRHFEPKLLAQ